MNKAISSSEKFIKEVIPDSPFYAHFDLALSRSEVVDGKSTGYPFYFNDSITFLPSGYKMWYCLTLDGDTLNASIIIPIDSFGRPAIDTTHYLYDDLKEYGKLLAGYYKYDYAKVKYFIKSKRLKNYTTQFMSSIGRIDDRDYIKVNPHRYFWYIAYYQKGRTGREVICRIDPKTGEATLLIHRHPVVN